MYDVAALRVGPVRIPSRPFMPVWNSRAVSAATKLLLGGGRTGTVDFHQYRGRSELAVGIAGWRQTTVRGRRAYRAGLVGFDVRDRLREINVPAIVLHGTHDTYFRVREAQALATGLSAELRLLPGARHVPPLSHPQAVQAAVAALSRVSSARFPRC
jgi:pimeloyl-ACP methyl ester carboxylesterase